MNETGALAERLGAAMRGATSLNVAVAYLKLTGLERLGAIPGGRFVVGTGFGLTEPGAVERLAEAGVHVRLVVDSENLSAAAFHPKLYLVEGSSSLTVFSGSANLTGGGLSDNVEQFDEIRMPRESKLADTHRARFETLWDRGEEFTTLRNTGAWEAYKDLARVRAGREREFKRAHRRISKRIRTRLDQGLAADAAEILRRATDLTVQTRGHAHVLTDGTPGTLSFQRVGAEVRDGEFQVTIWPAELKDQARHFCSGRTANRLLRFADNRAGWSVDPTPHLAFNNSPAGQRLYLNPRLDKRAYIARWQREDHELIGGWNADRVRPELWPRLIRAGHASRTLDTPRLDWFERTLSGRQAHMRPGMRVRRVWSIDEAERLHARGRLAPAVRAAIDRLLIALDEPSLR